MGLTFTFLGIIHFFFDVERVSQFSIFRNSKVPEGVCIALKAIFEEIGGLTENEAETYFTGLEKSRRLQTETWS